MATDLDAIAAQIREKLESCERYAKKSFAAAVEAGELLIKAKAEVPHGAWLSWLEANVSCSDRQANKYMMLAENRQMLDDEIRPGADLSINAALRIIESRADPVPPKEFPLYTADLATDFCCPNCLYAWNGNPKAGEKTLVKLQPEEIAKKMIAVRLDAFFKWRVARQEQGQGQGQDQDQDQDQPLPQIELVEAE